MVREAHASASITTFRSVRRQPPAPLQFQELRTACVRLGVRITQGHGAVGVAESRLHRQETAGMYSLGKSHSSQRDSNRLP